MIAALQTATPPTTTTTMIEQNKSSTHSSKAQQMVQKNSKKMIEKFPFSPTKRSTSLQSTVVFSKAMIDSSVAIVSRSLSLSLSLSEYKRKFFSPKTLIEFAAIVSRSLSLWEHKIEESERNPFLFFLVCR
jgi:hypothetical protein